MIVLKCSCCGSTNLKDVKDFEMEHILTNAPMIRDVSICKECESVHYIENGRLSYEYTPEVCKDRSFDASGNYNLNA